MLAVIGHEYFHNWSGNRVTCRDWFQLSLKEGLTVYREQEFESDLSSRTLRRIEDVRGLWRAQFPEDSGPLAHAVRPQQYEEINNFYTATVYEKGAEIVRMLANVLGRDGFRRGLDLYFERHDGDAVTIEDFLRALGDANQRDLQPWLHWYAQAGTPELEASGHYLAQSRCYELTLRQHTAPTPGQSEKRALPIPVAIALFDTDGHALPLRLDGETLSGANERVLLLESAQATFRFHDIDVAPIASLLRGYSAPVRLQHAADAPARAHLVAHESDGFNRWLAADSLFRSVFGDFLLSPVAAQPQIGLWTDCLRRALTDRDADPALHAELLTLPDVDTLSEGRRPLDPEALYQARATLERMLAGSLESELIERHDALRERGQAPDTRIAAQARRRLRNRCLALLVRADPAHLDLARRQFADTNNLTDRLAALTCLVHHGAADADTALATFAERYRDAPLVIDKWFSVQATRPDPDALADVQRLVDHPAFTWVNPNKVYALIGALAQRNPRAFHRADGAGYRFVADAIARLDAITPQVAARLATAFRSWRDLEPARRAHMHHELERLSARTDASADLTDILTRSLA